MRFEKKGGKHWAVSKGIRSSCSVNKDNDDRSDDQQAAADSDFEEFHFPVSDCVILRCCATENTRVIVSL
jgi:hypothetical protein